MSVRPLRTRRLRGAAIAAIATVTAATFLVQTAPTPLAEAATTATAAATPVTLALAPAAVRTPVAARPVVLPYKVGTKKYNQWYAMKLFKVKYHWNYANFKCLNNIYQRESGWNQRAHNRSGAHGIPQAMPGKKMAKFGADWRTNPNTQLKWGLNYIYKVYKTPCRAWSFWRAHHWY